MRRALTAVLLLTLAAACGVRAKPRIGVSVATMQEAVYGFMKGAILEEAAREGAEVIWVSAENSEAKQVADVDALLAQSVDVLILHAVNTATAAALVGKASAAGVPVVAMDRLPTGAAVRCYVTANSREVGRLQARFLAEKAERGAVVILEGEAGNSVAAEITAGNLEILEASPGLRVEMRRAHKSWARDLAALTVEDAVVRFGRDLRGVLANNSGMAMGAVEALRARGLADRVVTVGADADRDACAAILAGDLWADVDKMPREIGRAAMRAALQLHRGEAIKPDETVESGGVLVPVLLTPVRLVTREDAREAMRYRWPDL